jgi:hypothetical protein
MPTRYWIALSAAVGIVVGGVAFCIQTRRTVIATMREAIAGVERTPENAEALAAAEQSLDSGALVAEFGMEVPQSLLWRIQLAEFLQRFWPIWVMFVVGTCFAVAWLVGGRRPVGAP